MASSDWRRLAALSPILTRSDRNERSIGLVEVTVERQGPGVVVHVFAFAFRRKSNRGERTCYCIVSLSLSNNNDSQ